MEKCVSPIRIKLKGVQYVNNDDSERNYAAHSERPVCRALVDVSPTNPAYPFY